MSKQNLTALVDELGAVKAEVAELTKRERELKAALIAAGVDTVDGRYFRAAIVRTESTVVNWKEVAKRCSRQLIAAHRTVKQRVEVRVHARVRDAA
jgi:hypothetical protein